jgi:hypothetical protein
MAFTITTKIRGIKALEYEFGESEIQNALIEYAKAHHRFKHDPLREKWTMELCESGWNEDTDKKIPASATLVCEFIELEEKIPTTPEPKEVDDGK